MLCLDDYFMSEKEKTEKDAETGKIVKKRVSSIFSDIGIVELVTVTISFDMNVLYSV